MKRLILLTVLAGALPLGMMAQDDLYFTPKKSVKESTVKSVRQEYDNTPAYYSGSNRNVDEYNRRGKYSSYYQKIGSDSLGNDIIEFHAGNGQYPDSTVLDTIYPGSPQYYANGGSDGDDFAYSRRMNRFDNEYGWYDPYFYEDLYWDGPYWGAGWGWYSPWYRGYYGWGYPYWGGYWGWYDPWYYGSYWGYYGWPYYGGWWGPGYAWHGGHTGTRGHSFAGGGVRPGNGGNPSGYRGTPGNYRGGTGNRTFGNFGNGRNGTRSTWGNTTAGNSNNGTGWRGSQPYNPNNNGFNGTRSYTPRSNSNWNGGSTRSFGSSSSGGSRSFGGGGGGHSFGGGGGRSGGGGGGHFGGGRR